MTKQIEYKKTRLPWCPEIPKDWDVVKLSYDFLKIGSGTTPQAGNPIYYQDGEFNWLQTGDLNDGLITGTSKKITQKALDDYSTLRFYSIGSLVIAMYGATIGKSGILGIETTTNQACCVLAQPTRFDTKFIYYWFHSNKYNIISLSYGGGQPNISQELIRNLRVQCPPIELQKDIANFLDQKTAEIDTIILRKKKLIDLLNEERTKLINDYVVKGIRKNVNYKFSGVQWVGDIPNHWEFKKVKYVATINDEVISEKTDEDTEINYVEIADIDFVNGLNNFTTYRFKDAPSRARRIAKEGDILISTVRTYLKAITRVENSIKNLIVSTGFAVLRPRELNSKYLGFVALSNFFIDETIANSVGVSYPAINSSQIGEFKIPVPPLNEQEEIVHFIETELDKIKGVISKIEQELTLINEYRTSLINEVVTGKITLN